MEWTLACMHPARRGNMIHRLVSRTVACLMTIGLSTGLVAQNAAGGGPARVTHVLGLEGAPNNANGNLSIQQDALQFQRGAGPAAQISLGSIEDVSLSEANKQMGGTPMAVTRAATPFGGGHVIGLFSHKKYDILTVEYRDANRGLHGAIFQLNKGQGQVFRSQLAAAGVHVNAPSGEPSGGKDEVQ